MIAVHVDEAHAFDMLCIACIKKSSECTNILEDIGVHLNMSAILEVMHSYEYAALHKANQDIYDKLNQLDAGAELAAKTIHDLNKLRFQAKRALQRKFFESSLTEQKNHG
jgi:hypothetical protein